MEVNEWLQISMFLFTLLALLAGFPVAFTLSGCGLIFAGIGILAGSFDASFLSALPERVFGVMINETLVAVPLFVFMGVILERSKVSELLLETMSEMMGGLRGGLGVSVCLVGGLLAASTGIVGATVVTMGLISLPSMLKQKYSPSLASGIICSSGTLGQIIPPSIVLIILGDVIGSAHQQAQLALGNWSPTSVSVGDLFVGALIPGLCLMFLYILTVIGIAILKPEMAPQLSQEKRVKFWSQSFMIKILKAFLPPILLIFGVLGSILSGIALPSEAAAVGSIGAILLAYFNKNLSWKVMKEVVTKTGEVNAMVFTILIGASIFSLVFRGYGGDESVQNLLTNIVGGVTFSFFLVMLVMFLLGFFLDFFEIIFVVVPLVGPALLQMGLDPVWLGVMIAINLQTSFLTPPFGFSLFYLRGVAPLSVKTSQIYRGVVPFIGVQLLMLVVLWFFPEMATWLPSVVFDK